MADSSLKFNLGYSKFLVNVNQQVSSIEASTLLVDAHKAGTAAHTLKSAARSVGALALGELCEQIETAVFVASDAQACTELAHRLAQTLALAQHAINQHLAQ